jgi:LacI family transcriptional regulator
MQYTLSMSDKKTTIYNIAEQAGVSISTVSRVLNGSPLVSPKTRAQVQALITRHRFSPNPIARNLSGSKSKSIGIILPDITNPYFASLFLEIERYTIEQGYSAALFNTLYGSFSHSFSKSLAEKDYFRMALDKRLDGIILTGGQIDMDAISGAYLEALNTLRKEIPVVIIGQKIEGIGGIFIERNLERGVRTVIQHLYNLGHRRIGFIGGEVGVRITSDRFKAYQKILAELDLPFNRDFVHFSDYYAGDGYAAMQKQLRFPMPTALAAINDTVALGAIRAAVDAGLSIPQDLAIASCDKFFFGDYTVPRITSLDQQNDYLGRLAIVELINLMQGVAHSNSVSPPSPCLVIRESCGAPLGLRQFS